MTATTSPTPSPTPTVPVAPARPGGASLAGLTGIEIRSSLSTRSGRSVAAAAVLIGPTAVLLASTGGEGGVPVGFALGVVGMLTGLVLLALGVLATAGEWTHGSVQTSFLLVPRRSRVLAAKSAAVAALGAVLSAAGAGGALLVLWAGSAPVDWTGPVAAVAAVVAGGAAFAVIGAGVGAALANAPAALTIGYLVLLGGLPVLRAVEPGIAEWIDPTEAVLVLAGGAQRTEAVTALAGWVVASTVAGVLLTRRRAVR